MNVPDKYSKNYTNVWKNDNLSLSCLLSGLQSSIRFPWSVHGFKKFLTIVNIWIESNSDEKPLKLELKFSITEFSALSLIASY